MTKSPRTKFSKKAGRDYVIPETPTPEELAKLIGKHVR